VKRRPLSPQRVGGGQVESSLDEHRERSRRGGREGQERDALELLEQDTGLEVGKEEGHTSPDSQLRAQQESVLELLQLTPGQHEQHLVHDLVLEQTGKVRRAAQHWKP